MAEGRIPGYGGHVQGERDSYGATFGNTTSTLASGEAAPGSEPRTMEEGRQFVVGYTGHIPLARELIAKNYRAQAETALNAHERLRTTRERSSANGAISPQLAATISRGASAGTVPQTISPRSLAALSLPSSAPGRLPGYTGFVPLYRDQSLGRGYGMATGGALEIVRLPPAERTGALRVSASGAGHAADRSGEASPPIPGFTGHVPGKRDVLSHTYSQAASTALSDFVKDQRLRRAEEMRATMRLRHTAGIVIYDGKKPPLAATL